MILCVLRCGELKPEQIPPGMPTDDPDRLAIFVERTDDSLGQNLCSVLLHGLRWTMFWGGFAPGGGYTALEPKVE